MASMHGPSAASASTRSHRAAAALLLPPRSAAPCWLTVMLASRPVPSTAETRVANSWG